MNNEQPKLVNPASVACNLWHESESLVARLDRLNARLVCVSNMLDKRLLGEPVPVDPPAVGKGIDRLGLVADLELFTREQHKLLDKAFDKLDAIQELLD